LSFCNSDLIFRNFIKINKKILLSEKNPSKKILHGKKNHNILEPVILEALEFVSPKVDEDECFTISKGAFGEDFYEVILHKEPLQSCCIFKLAFFELGNSVFC